MQPKLRFNGFTSPWQKVRLGEITDVSGGGTPSTTCEENWEGNIQWFTPSEVGQSKYVSRSNRTITQKGFDESSTVMLPIGTILLSSRATIGEASITLSECTTNQGFQSLVPKKTSSEFIFALVHTLKKKLIKEANGSTFLEISGNKVRNLKVQIPSSTAEQEAIGEFFKQLDEQVNSSEAEIARLKQLKKGALQALFPQPGENIPKIRFNGFSKPWKQVRLNEIGTFNSNGVDKKIYKGQAIINLLNYMDVYSQKTITKDNCSSLMQVSASEKQITSCNINAGDIFFTPSSETPEDIGHVMVTPETLPNTCYSYHLMRFRPHPGFLDINFPNYGFQTEFVRTQLRLAAKGVQRYVISKPDFENLKVLVPSYEEQAKIGEFFKQLDAQISLQEKKLLKLKQLKQAALNQMFV